MNGKTSKQLHEEWKLKMQDNLHELCGAIQYRLEVLTDLKETKYLPKDCKEQYEEQIDLLGSIYDALV